jgi:hypothetical protein
MLYQNNSGVLSKSQHRSHLSFKLTDRKAIIICRKKYIILTTNHSKLKILLYIKKKKE